jgi:hypothetical protein
VNGSAGVVGNQWLLLKCRTNLNQNGYDCKLEAGSLAGESPAEMNAGFAIVKRSGELRPIS